MTKSFPITASDGGSSQVMPLEGRCSFVFLDGHSKSLSPDTAFEKGQGTPPMEDGQALSVAPQFTSYHNTEYVLWNIY